jgi:competence protein ComEC
MASGTIAFRAGILAVLHLPFLPPGLNFAAAWGALAATAAALIPVRTPALRWLLLAAAGFGYTLLYSANTLEARLPAPLEGHDLQVEGRILDLPEAGRHRIRFEFQPEALQSAGIALSRPPRLRLSWYGGQPPEPGAYCRLKVRLKRPRGMVNPGGFDFEGWLFQHGIGATGYVRDDPDNRCDKRPPGPSVAQVRQRVRGQFKAGLQNSPFSGLLTALAVGDRSGISDDQWRVLRATGTSHLVAISGLHVGLVAGLVFFLIRRLWRASFLLLRCPAPSAAAAGAILAAAGYAALAGFSVPTQRALVMVVAGLLPIILRRRTVVGNAWAWALAGVLLFDPLAPLSAGFWLSFSAVALILFAMGGRLRAGGLWWRWGRVQWVAALGLAPMVISFFGELSLSAPLANLFAVPWVGLVVVPVTLVAAVAATIAPALSLWPIQLAAWLMQPFWAWLQWCAAMAPPVFLPQVPLWIALAAGAGAVLLLLPRGLPLRGVGLIWLLPLIFYRAPVPGYGEARMTLLDVGEGLSAVVRTRSHTLVFDAGARYRTGFDLGQAAVAPFLRAAGVRRIDRLVISHGDNDHIGGARHLLERFPVDSLVTGVPQALANYDPERCRRGQHWSWDGVEFTILHPQTPLQDNNGSCVLLVRTGGGAVLLPGDIERPAETELVAQYGERLHAEILVAPHHGSKTSSSPAFVRAVRPDVVLFPVGYRNRYGFPHRPVVARYRAAGARLFGTARDGALVVTLAPGKPPVVLAVRSKLQRFWHSTGDALGGWSAL